MPSQRVTLRTQAQALAGALEAVVPELRALRLSAVFDRERTDVRPSAGMRQGLHDLLTMASDLSGAQLRLVAAELRHRHGIELDSLQQRRLARLTIVRDRGRITSDEQWYLVRSRIDEISGFESQSAECEELQRLADGYEFRHAKA